jgi:hypothetical protein
VLPRNRFASDISSNGEASKAIEISRALHEETHGDRNYEREMMAQKLPYSVFETFP